MSLGLRIKWNLLQVKVVVVVVVLCFASRVSRSLAQSQTPEINDDLLCLQSLQSSLSGKSVEFLTGNWTGLEFPCKGNTTYAGLLCNHGQVIDISLRSMRLEGTIPSSIIQCNKLANLDLSDNRLSGTIPPEIGQLEQLVVLNLSLNRLGGAIPDFSKAKFTNVIDLHGNDLTGNIPSSLGFLERLSTFDVSDNDLSGPIPQNLANNTATGEERFNASSFEGNRGLYGYPLQPPSNHGLSVLAIVGIGLGSGMLSLVVSFTAVCIWLRVTEQRGAAEEGKISQLMPES